MWLGSLKCYLGKRAQFNIAWPEEYDRYCIYHVKFNVCLVTKPHVVFSSETKWLNASLLFLRMNYVKNV